MGGGKQAVAGVVEDETTEAARLEKRVVRLSQASTALARRWLRAAQDSIQARFRERGKKLRDDCEECLGEMPEEDEWFYGADLRFEGRQVLTRGDALRADQLTIDEERAVFEAKLQKLADEANRKLELRTRELERTKDLRKKERDEEGAASSATLAKHRDILDSIDQEIEGAREAVEKQRKAYEGEQRGFFDRHESLQIQVIADRRISAITNIRQIRKETQAKIRGDENKWQNDAARWLSTGRRKVELKKREDADMEAAKRRRGQ